MVSRINLSVLFLAYLLRSIYCNVLVEQNQRLDRILEEIEENFNAANSNYWEFKQKVDDEFVHGNQAHATEYLNLAKHGTFIELVKYAILRKSIQAGKRLLNGRFTNDSSGNLVDKEQKLFMLKLIVPTIISRLLLRAYADSERYTERLMNRLHIFIEQSVEKKKDPDMIKAAVKIYKLLDKFEASFQKHFSGFQQSLDNVRNQIETLKEPMIVAVLDQTIDEAMGCNKCSAQMPEKEYYNTNSMFESIQSIYQALDEMVDQKLTAEFSDYQDAGDVEYVTKEEVLSLMKRVLIQYDSK